MAHNKKFGEFMAAVVAAYPQAITSTKLEVSSINATGFDRASFIFEVGAPTSVDAYISSGILIWNASTSGAAYTTMAGASFGTHITGGASKANYVIDVDISPSYPWLRVSASNCSSTGTYSVVCVLRTPANLPPTALSGQIVHV